MIGGVLRLLPLVIHRGSYSPLPHLAACRPLNQRDAFGLRGILLPVYAVPRKQKVRPGDNFLHLGYFCPPIEGEAETIAPREY